MSNGHVYLKVPEMDVVAEVAHLVGSMNGSMKCPGHTKLGEVCNMCAGEKRKEDKLKVVVRSDGPVGLSLRACKKPNKFGKSMVSNDHEEWIYWEGYVKGHRDGTDGMPFDVEE